MNSGFVDERADRVVPGPSHALVCHPAHPPRGVRRVTARVTGHDAHWLSLRWRIEGGAAVVRPPFAGPGRADGLWRTTCFELFVKPERSKAYSEFNFSPSERWAAYDFSGWRAGITPRAMPRGTISAIRGQGALLIFDVSLPTAGLPRLPAAIGLAAVIEEVGGHKSYWALAHAGATPDFHHPDCFALTLPASAAP